MSVKTLQVTQTGSTIAVSATPIKCKWATFQNNAAAVMRVGDANTTASRGYSLAASGGAFTPPPSTNSTFTTDLSQWSTVGTLSQVLDVVYDDMTF